VTENDQSLVNENSYEPTAERAFMLECWRIPRRRNFAVLHRHLLFFMAAKYAECEEMQKRTASPEPLLE
jgi:hypothetical protein